MNQWVTRSQKIVYTNPYFRVREDEVIRPKGDNGTFYIIESKDCAVIIPISEQNHIYLQKISRYPTHSSCWELPMGGIENNDPLVSAQTELREEMGFSAQSWELINTQDISNGNSDAKGYVFLAKRLTQLGTTLQEDEGILEVQCFSIDRIITMIRNEEIRDTKSIAALLLYINLQQ